MKKGLLVIVSGPSGAGKGTVLKQVFEKYPNLKLSISVTTRAPRVGEADGINYYFKTVEEYNEMLKKDEFLEHQEVYGNFYGTPKAKVFEQLDKGFDVVLEIDVKGALSVMQRYPEAISIFVSPQDRDTLASRLKGRGSERPEDLERRISEAAAEIQQANLYDYIVVNNDVTECAEDVISIVRAEKCSVKLNRKFIDSLTNGGK